MEPPKPETDQRSGVRNGDSAAGGAPNGSGSESQGPPPERIVSSSGSVKKSVHWSPELVTESTFVSSPHESRFNPRSYFSSSFSSASSSSSSSSQSASSVTFFGEYSPFFLIYFLVTFIFMHTQLHACVGSVWLLWNFGYFDQKRWWRFGMCWEDGERRWGRQLGKLRISLETRGSTVSFLLLYIYLLSFHSFVVVLFLNSKVCARGMMLVLAFD